MMSANRSLDQVIKEINKKVTILIELKDKRNQYMIDPPRSLAPERIDELTNDLKKQINKLEEEVVAVELEIARTHKDYHPARLDSPSFLEPRKLPGLKNKPSTSTNL